MERGLIFSVTAFLRVFCVICLIFCLNSEAFASVANLEKAIARSKISKDQLGLLITDSDGKTVFGLNEDKLLIPASITKLATTLGATQNQDLSTQFRTQLLTTSSPENGILKGNLYFKGGGDPSFVSENLWFLVNYFQRTGIKQINGDIIADDSIFDRVRYDESREDVRVSRAYDAPVGGLSFNWNSVNVFVRPGKRGEKAKVFIDPENNYFEIENRTTTSGGAGKELSIEKTSASGKFSEKIIVRGQIGEKATEHVIYANISNPDIWAGENLRAFLEQRGVTVSGKVKFGVTPASADIVAEYTSKSFGHILADMNKFSNNFVAEMLTKNLAVGEKPATLDGGVKKIQKALSSIGLTSAQFKIINPSGLTRENRFTATAMVKILQALRSDYRWKFDVYNSLPISGIDGTLKKRMKDPDMRGRVRAKTGLLNNVASLAGFANADDGREFIFSFMFNGSSDEAKVRALYDDLLQEVIVSK